MLFGITVTKDLRQFHDRTGITHRPQSVASYLFIGLKQISDTVASNKIVSTIL